MRMRINNKGFTLIELMIVIAVIAILITIGSLSFYGGGINNNYRSEGSARLAMLRLITNHYSYLENVNIECSDDNYNGEYIRCVASGTKFINSSGEKELIIITAECDNDFCTPLNDR